MFFKEFSGFLLLTSYASASCLHGTSHLLRRATSDGGVEVSKFGYTELKGPLHWAGLSTDNSACAIGTKQSPINMGMSNLKLLMSMLFYGCNTDDNKILLSILWPRPLRFVYPA